MTDNRHNQAPGDLQLAIAHAAACHQLGGPFVLDDPMATKIVGLNTAMLAHILPGGADFRADMRLFLAMTDRFIDDIAANAAAAGVEQFVHLNSALDTTFYRKHYPNTRLFEVDRGSAQRWKRHRLVDTGIGIPPNLTFAPLDDDRDTLEESLQKAGYEFGRSTLVMWPKRALLPDKAILDTYAWLAKHEAHLEVVTDYSPPLDLLPDHIRENVGPVLGLVEQMGQPFVSYFTAAQMESDLQAAGLRIAEDVSWDELVARYQPAHADTPDPLGARLLHAVRN